MGYRTEQKKLLLLYLSTHAERAFSLAELADTMAECGVGKSTVYRLVAQMCEEGAVRRCAKERGRGYLYQYLDRTDCAAHLHLRCTDCGKITHLGEEETALFERVLAENNRFVLDDQRTLLFGRCAACWEKGKSCEPR